MLHFVLFISCILFDSCSYAFFVSNVLFLHILNVVLVYNLKIIASNASVTIQVPGPRQLSLNEALPSNTFLKWLHSYISDEMVNIWRHTDSNWYHPQINRLNINYRGLSQEETIITTQYLTRLTQCSLFVRYFVFNHFYLFLLRTFPSYISISV